MFAKSGDALPPCGVPSSTRKSFPSSSTPAFNHFWMRRTTRRSAIRWDELDQPFVRNPIEKALKVKIEHPVHPLRQQSGVERVQRVMRAAPWPEPVREAEKVRFVDGVQHLDRGTLGDLIFQRRDTERPLPPVGLGDVHPPHRLGSVRSSLQPLGQILEVFFQALPVVLPHVSPSTPAAASLFKLR